MTLNFLKNSLLFDPGSMLSDDGEINTRQVLGEKNVFRYVTIRSTTRKGKSTREVAKKLTNLILRKCSGRFYSRSKIFICLAIMAKILVRNLFLKMAIKTRFQNENYIPNEIVSRTNTFL